MRITPPPPRPPRLPLPLPLPLPSAPESGRGRAGGRAAPQLPALAGTVGGGDGRYAEDVCGTTGRKVGPGLGVQPPPAPAPAAVGAGRAEGVPAGRRRDGAAPAPPAPSSSRSLRTESGQQKKDQSSICNHAQDAGPPRTHPQPPRRPAAACGAPDQCRPHQPWPRRRHRSRCCLRTRLVRPPGGAVAWAHTAAAPPAAPPESPAAAPIPSDTAFRRARIRNGGRERRTLR
jgi:hypothetical protein